MPYMSFPASNVAADPRGLVILLVDWLEGASLSVQHPIFGS
jgi:hypothetical protein